jgi:hypothetical protein
MLLTFRICAIKTRMDATGATTGIVDGAGKISVEVCGDVTRPSLTVRYIEAIQSIVVQRLIVASNASVAHLKRVRGPR